MDDILVWVRGVIILIVTLFVIFILSRALQPLYQMIPQPMSFAVSFYSTWEDTADVSTMIVGLILTFSGILGVALVQEKRLLFVAIAGVVFILFSIFGM
jgi:hypothetical protein